MIPSTLPTQPDELREWFDGVVTRNYRLLFATAYRILEKPQDSEDAVQSAVLKAYLQLETLRDRVAVVGWLTQITRHVALDVKKSSWHQKLKLVEHDTLDSEENDQNDASSAGGALAEDDRRLLRQEVGRLPESLAVVVTLRHLEDLDTNEVAQRLGIKPNAARVRLFRAYERLRVNPRIRSLFGWEAEPKT